MAERNVQRGARAAALLRRRNQRRALARAPCAPARPSSDAGSRPHAPVRRFRRPRPPCRSCAPWRRRCRARRPPSSTAIRRAPRRSRSAARGPRHIGRQRDFRSRRSPPRAGSAARPSCPISRWVSSTTVTILRMMALIAVCLPDQACTAFFSRRSRTRSRSSALACARPRRRVSPCNRNAAPSINPAASSRRAQSAPASSASSISLSDKRRHPV